MKTSVGSSNQSRFSYVPSAEIQRSVFERDHTHKTAFNCGRLVPIYVDEVLPGDTFQISVSFLMRTTTPVVPVMDDLEAEFFFFFVPNRLVWSGWQALHGENKNTAWVPSVPAAKVPAVAFSSVSVAVGSIGDYFGLPVDADYTLLNDEINVLPFRAYGLIWNEWFRDQNLQAPITINITSSNDPINFDYHPNRDLLKVNKKHDYFTSCLPAPLKSTSVFLPLNGQAPVVPLIEGVPGTGYTGMRMSYGGSRNLAPGLNLATNPVNTTGKVSEVIGASNFTGSASQLTLMPDNLWADLENATSTTIAELRQAFQLQRLFERDARGGTRYTEIIRSHFGVVSPDSRLQRPEYLGGFKERMGMYQVNQTSPRIDGLGVGGTGAFSHTSGSFSGINQSFTEHGYIFGFVTVRNRKTYSQGISRMWFKRDRFDFYYPALAHISEQPVYTRELSCVSGTLSDINQVFGYQEAWAEYRYMPNRISGALRPMPADSLSAWHYGDYYNTPVSLSSSWIEDNTETNVNRTLIYDSSVAPQIIADFMILNRAARPMPTYSVPGLVDHF